MGTLRHSKAKPKTKGSPLVESELGSALRGRGLDVARQLKACLTWIAGDLRAVVRSWGIDRAGSWCPTGCRASSARVFRPEAILSGHRTGEEGILTLVSRGAAFSGPSGVSALAVGAPSTNPADRHLAGHRPASTYAGGPSGLKNGLGVGHGLGVGRAPAAGHICRSQPVRSGD